MKYIKNINLSATGLIICLIIIMLFSFVGFTASIEIKRICVAGIFLTAIPCAISGYNTYKNDNHTFKKYF